MNSMSYVNLVPSNCNYELIYIYAFVCTQSSVSLSTFVNKFNLLTTDIAIYLLDASLPF